MESKLEQYCKSGPPEQGGVAEVASAPPPPQKFFGYVPFFLMSPLNVLFLKEVTQNLHENQQAKSRTDLNKTAYTKLRNSPK